MISLTRGGAAVAGGLVALVVTLVWLARYVPAVLVATPPADTRPAPPADTLGDIPAGQWLAASGPLGGDPLARARCMARRQIRRALADTAATQGHAPVPEHGVRVGAERRGDSLIVTLVPARAFKVVRSPPNEIWLEGMTAAPAALIGDRFAGSASGDVRYFDGVAHGAVLLPTGRPSARGHVVVRSCDTETGVCLQREVRFDVF